MKKILLTTLVLVGITATAQVKVGSNPTTLATNANFQVEGTTTAEQLVVLKNGNVGIGTTAPTKKLEVVGDAGAASATFAGGKSLLRLTGNTGFSEPMIEFGESTLVPTAGIAAKNVSGGSGHLIFSTRLTTDAILVEKMRILDSGFVGIGTTTPSNRLSVTSGTDDARVDITSTSSVGIIKAVANTDNSIARWLSINPNGGNVGIGTTTPSHKLVVLKDAMSMPTYAPSASFAARFIGNTATTGISLENYNTSPSGGNYFLGLDANGTETAPTATLVGDWLTVFGGRGYEGTTFSDAGRMTILATENWNATSGGGAIAFSTKSNGTHSMPERMRIDHNGNVGIGTTTPTAKLHIAENNLNDTKLYGIYAPVFVDKVATTGTVSGSLVDIRTDATDTADHTYMFVDASRSFHYGTGTIADQRAITSSARNRGTGNVTSQTGLYMSNSNENSGTVINSTTVYGENINSGSGVITTANSLYATVINNGSGTITNGYGVRIGAVQATNKWSLYAEDATAPSYFAGSVGIGTTMLGSKLHSNVSGNSLIWNATLQNDNNSPNDLTGVGLKFKTSNYIGATEETKWSGIAGVADVGQPWNNELGIAFYTKYGTSVAPVENVRITGNGRVGIGTATPTSKLQVVGLPVHASNAAAITAGLTAGAFYHAGDGIVRVVF